MNILTNVKVPTSLVYANNSFDNNITYSDWLSWEIYDLMASPLTIETQSRTLGRVKVSIYIDGNTLDSHFNGNINVKIIIDEDNNDKEDLIQYKFEKDLELQDFIIENIKNFINELNSAVKHIKHPINEVLVFKCERYFMEISPDGDFHTPEFKQFSYDIDFNETQLIDNISII